MASELILKTTDGTHPILVGENLLEQSGTIVRRLEPHNFSARCAIVTNPTVGKIYAARVAESLRENGFEPSIVEMPDGEQFKTIDTLKDLYDQLIDARLDRRSIVFALGGGVVGDVAGFAAATLMRGVQLVQMPTTVLAMVDAGVGGKTAVDHPRGKNLIGAFKLPRAVIVDTQTLSTLPDAEFRSGMAEVVKHGVLQGGELFDKLEIGNWKLQVASWLAQAIQVKVDVVTRDPFEQGERAKLNLGHTFGHAFEKLSNYSMRHGDAVAIGTICAARLARNRQWCEDAFVARIEKLLVAIGLPTRVPHKMATDAILAAMQTDKKMLDGKLHFIVPRGLGDVVIANDVRREEVEQVVEGLRDT
jgi:3-dehydroquinate synthase